MKGDRELVARELRYHEGRRPETLAADFWLRSAWCRLRRLGARGRTLSEAKAAMRELGIKEYSSE